MKYGAKLPGSVRDHFHNTRFTSEEFAQIRYNAAAIGLSVGDYLRRRALDYRLPVTLAIQKQIAAAVTSIDRIGNNINQLTHRAHLGREPSLRYLQALGAELSAIVARLLTFLK